MKLHLLEAPLRPSGSIKQFEADVETLIGTKADVLGLTNVTSTRRKALIRVGKRSGYNVVQDNESNTALLVKHEVAKSSFTPNAGENGAWAMAKFDVDGQAVVVVQGQSTGDAKTDNRVVAKGVATLKKEVRGRTVGFLLADSGVTEIANEAVTAVWEQRKRPTGDVGVAGALGEASSTRIVRRADIASVEGTAISFYYEVGATDGGEPKAKPAKKAAAKKAAPAAEESPVATTADLDGTTEVAVATDTKVEDAVKPAKKASPRKTAAKKTAPATKTSSTRKRAAKKETASV